MGGKKFDAGKRRWDLVDFQFLDGLVDIVTYGAAKYDDNNWQGVDKERYVAALMRHISAWRQGEESDQESGLHHLLHATCNLMFLYYKEINHEKEATNKLWPATKP